MRKTIYIIDGYNVIHRVPRLRNTLARGLEPARRALLRYCSDWMRRRGDVWKFYVVFDGDSSVTGSHRQITPAVYAVFSRTGETADERIIEIVREQGADCRFVVVSDDNFVSGTAKQCDAEHMTTTRFLEVLTVPTGGPAAQREQEESKQGLSPSEEHRINESLKREWGL